MNSLLKACSLSHQRLHVWPSLSITAMQGLAVCCKAAGNFTPHKSSGTEADAFLLLSSELDPWS